MFKMISIAALERAASLFPTLTQTQTDPITTQLTQPTVNTNAIELSNQTDRSLMNDFMSNNLASSRTANMTSQVTSDPPISKDHMLTMSSNKLRSTWGRRIAVRMATAWNRYLQTPNAKALFKIHGGLSNGITMGELSVLWKSMSPQERAAFKAPIPDVELDFGEKIISNKRAQQIVQPRTIVKSNPTSLQKAEKQVQSFMTDILAQATPIAASCNCEFVFFAVSNHLATHSFQHRVVTPGAHRGVELITETAGLDEFAAQIQGYVTGNTTEAIEAKRQCGNNSKAVRKQVAAGLGRLVFEHTNTALSKWPWKNTDAVLATFGLRLTLRSDSKLDINCLKRPCAELSGPDSCLIDYELDHGGITLLPISSSQEVTVESQI
ncbi:Hypothetical protein MELLADRAFT_69817 [Melampsora larici-populina 98AG31]|uniref:Uncharacterized protein n=1 Tax=Melampsora larici-populina (strain 98AG31 / pathotype 3-4-7) TaxID=747676 RepID=F4SCA1_MELLP|nr:Hypothetical protein MELLADRAFT_69817 [Melampsora larici-populina 98AG31]EGF97724.1 Hypothetical protein MELLADRAFT_69817 [Melampsora larici-populina 98AG31]